MASSGPTVPPCPLGLGVVSELGGLSFPEYLGCKAQLTVQDPAVHRARQGCVSCPCGRISVLSGGHGPCPLDCFSLCT